MVKTTIGIDGMMCSMCEAHVNDAIRRHFSVKKAKSDHRRGTCVVVSKAPLEEASVAAALKDMGYRVTSFVQEPYRRRGVFGAGR